MKIFSLDLKSVGSNFFLSEPTRSPFPSIEFLSACAASPQAPPTPRRTAGQRSPPWSSTGNGGHILPRHVLDRDALQREEALDLALPWLVVVLD
jgi:hypothetical protein